MSEGDLPPRLQVRVHGDRVRDVGLYAAQSDNFLLVTRDTQSQTEIWDTEATTEVRLQFLSGDVVGEGVVPYRGTALGELPWAFRGDANECPFIGEGSVSNRAPEIVVLAPDGCTTDCVSALEESSARESEGLDPSTGDNIRVLSRILWRIAEPTAIKAAHGRCVVRPSSGQVVEEDYRLEGQRCYDLESAWPLFCGTPRLRVFKAEQAPARRTDQRGQLAANGRRVAATSQCLWIVGSPVYARRRASVSWPRWHPSRTILPVARSRFGHERRVFGVERSGSCKGFESQPRNRSDAAN